MRKRKLCVLAVTCLLLCAAFSASGQRRDSRDDNGPHVWVGGAVNNSLRFGGGTFGFGLTPMAGYFIIPEISAGAFLRADYYYERFNNGFQFIRYSSLDLGPGIFVRGEVLRQFFAQLEFEHAFLRRAKYDIQGFPIIDNDGKVQKETIEQNYVYVGAGYFGGNSSVQYGISLHYNVLDDFYSIRFPWDYRITIKVPINPRS